MLHREETNLPLARKTPTCCFWDATQHFLDDCRHCLDEQLARMSGDGGEKRYQIEEWRKINEHSEEGWECWVGKGEEGKLDRGDKMCPFGRSRSCDERPQCGKAGEEGHKFHWACLSRLRGFTLGLFRWPSPSALHRCRHCRALLSEQQKLLRKRNPSGGRKEALRGFMASSSLHGLKIMTCEEVWESYGLELCTIQWTCFTFVAIFPVIRKAFVSWLQMGALDQRHAPRLIYSCASILVRSALVNIALYLLCHS